MQMNLLNEKMSHKLYMGNNMEILPSLESGSVNLICIDPPYNTGTERKFRSGSYNDSFESSNSYINWMELILSQCHRILVDNGSIFVIIDEHEKYNLWTLLRKVFGENNLVNELIWSYNWGYRATKRWSPKHDTIFWFAKDPDDYIFDLNECEHIAKRAPNLFEDGSETTVPTDVWWQTIVTSSSHESTGYPTQKPLKLIERIIKVHTKPGHTVLDCFAGSGTVGEASAKHACNSILIDKNPEAWKIIQERMESYGLQSIEKDS